MSEADDEVSQLLPAVRSGSPDRLGRALDRFRDYLLAIANRQLDSALQAKGGASDIVQETFLEAQRDFAQFSGTTGSELRAWLVRLLMNNVANFARHYKATGKRELKREVALPGDTPSGLSGGLAADTPTPSVEAMAEERAEAVRRAVDRLPEDYRRVILLRNREDRPFDEIARLMGRSENAVRKLWFRAVELLQHELGAAP
ncbi:MAG: sigma-70 family RNA polymerase sigma factor [Gemmataceae bacterium]